MITLLPQLGINKLPATPLVPAAPLSTHVGQDDSGFRQPQPEHVLRARRAPAEAPAANASHLGENIDITI